MGKTIQIKRGPKNTMPTLAQGELGMTTDAGSEGLFIGTGTENIEIARKSDLNLKPEDKPYLTFNSPSSFTLKVSDVTKHWDGTLEYSTDASTWSTWDGTTTLSAVDNDGEYILYLRGTGNTKIGYYDENGHSYASWVINGTDVRCNGNIETLLDYATVEAGQHPAMATYCYTFMFIGCTSLTQAPALPATTLTNYCYAGMFIGCTSLTQAPALPATTLADSCYASMLNGCTSLTQAPALPATTLASNCYASMFNGCTSLTQAPALPATTLASKCYANMFRDCTSLTQAPALPATTLAEDCYYYMFRDCTSLTQAPALPATTLASNCYNGMFRGCTGLTQAPALPATTLANNCYSNMFYGCTSLTQAPALPATTLENYCYASMFYGCTSLTQAPALPATTLASDCYDSMFRGCTSLTQAPALPATMLAGRCYGHMFENCTSLTEAPALPATTLTTYCYYAMFSGCDGLKLSTTQTGEYIQEYRIPSSGEGTTATDALYNMFYSTGGTFTGTPKINTTYYLSSDNMVVHDTEVATLREYVGSIAAPASHASDTDIHVTADEKTAWDAKATTTYVDQKISEIPTPDVSGQIGTHNSDSSAHSDIRESITTHTGNTSIHVTAEEKAVWNSKADAPFKPAGKSYLTFSSPNSFTLAVGDVTKHWDGTLEYFASNKSWTTWDGTTTLSSVDNDGEYALYLRGTGNTMITGGSSSSCKWVLTGTDISCIGNIENLLDYATVESGVHPTMATNCYRSMFRDCTSLTQVPALPATTLASNCYQNMFRDCTGLIQAPALPATTLADYCYSAMFYGCTALTQAPALPATTLATYCYSGMFYDCTSLAQAPALPATTLATNCYQNMFEGCTNLTQAPALPATTLANYCYYQMFFGCTALTQAPTLPATTLADHCYDSMFYGCTGLTQAPALPATTLANRCYNSMFNGCASLKLSSTQTGEYTVAYRIPTTGTGTTATDALTDMFTSTGGTFTGSPEINTTYYLSSGNMVVRETEVATLREYVGSIATPASHASDETIHVTAEEKAGWNAKADAPKSVTVMLAAASWDSTAKTQTVTVTGVKASETAQIITPTPALASQAAYYESGILCTGQAVDSLTFTATTVPTEDLTVYVVIQEVTQG